MNIVNMHPHIHHAGNRDITITCIVNHQSHKTGSNPNSNKVRQSIVDLRNRMSSDPMNELNYTRETEFAATDPNSYTNDIVWAF